MALLNTHLTVKKFIQFGFTEDQAEVVVEAINEQNKELTTKSDIALLELRLGSSIKDVENRLEAKIESLENRLEAKIEGVENRLESSIKGLDINIKWIMAFLLAILSILIAPLIKTAL